jgi:hypothetical protein
MDLQLQQRGGMIDEHISDDRLGRYSEGSWKSQTWERWKSTS